MADRKRVNLTVSPAQKEEWDNAVAESPEYSSLSGLIRTAVAHELSNGNGGDAGEVSPRTAEANTEALEEVTDTLARMQSTLNSLDERVGSVEQEVGASKSVDLKNEIFGILSQGELMSADEVGQEIDFEELEGDNIIKKLGSIRNTLDKLANQTGMVEKVKKSTEEPRYRRVD